LNNNFDWSYKWGEFERSGFNSSSVYKNKTNIIVNIKFLYQKIIISMGFFAAIFWMCGLGKIIEIYESSHGE
jgi:hypothetical protein